MISCLIEIAGFENPTVTQQATMLVGAFQDGIGRSIHVHLFQSPPVGNRLRGDAIRSGEIGRESRIDWLTFRCVSNLFRHRDSRCTMMLAGGRRNCHALPVNATIALPACSGPSAR